MFSRGLSPWLRLSRLAQNATFAFSLSGLGHLVASVIFIGSGVQMASLGECRRALFTFVFSLLVFEWVSVSFGFLVSFVGCTGFPFVPEWVCLLVSWSLGRLCWLYWVSFCLSECVLLPLVVGGWGIFFAWVSVSWVSWSPLLAVLGFLLLEWVCLWVLGRLRWLYLVSFLFERVCLQTVSVLF